MIKHASFYRAKQPSCPWVCPTLLKSKDIIFIRDDPVSQLKNLMRKEFLFSRTQLSALLPDDVWLVCNKTLTFTADYWTWSSQWQWSFISNSRQGSQISVWFGHGMPFLSKHCFAQSIDLARVSMTIDESADTRGSRTLCWGLERDHLCMNTKHELDTQAYLTEVVFFTGQAEQLKMHLSEVMSV